MPALASGEALTVLERLAGPALDSGVARAIVAATGGHPLALQEAVRRLSGAQLAGRAPLRDPLPTAETVVSAFEGRVGALPERARAALGVVALADSAPIGVLHDTLADLELSPGDLDPAAHAGLLADRHLGFAHPLVRNAALKASTAAAHRRANRALAAAWRRAGDRERAAWHLGEATDGRDATASLPLAQSVRAARARGALRSAAEAFRRAAEAADDDDARADLLYEAAFDLTRGGRAEEALELLDGVPADHASSAPRGEVDFLRGEAMWSIGRLDDAFTVLLDAASRTPETQVSRAVLMLCTAAFTRAIAGDIRTCVSTARRAATLARRGVDADRQTARFVLGWVEVLAGDGNRGYPRMRAALQSDSEGQAPMGSAVAPPFGQVACWMEDYDTARHDLDRSVARARSDGALPELCYALAATAELEFRTGDRLASRAHGTEALALGAASGLHQGYAGAVTGVLEAACGNGQLARRLLTDVLTLGERAGIQMLPIYAHSGLGLLELGEGMLDGALEHLEQTRRLVDRTGLREPNVVQWMPDLIETQVRLGRTADAQRTLERFERQAKPSGHRWARAAAGRCRGLLAGPADVDAVFADADRYAREVPCPFDQARLHLCWGERLRRDGRRVDARRHLGVALEQFEALGARPWAEHALREIRTSGVRARRAPGGRSHQLTAQELHVVLLVVEGLTNKEVASRLFLSPKTVEFHLGNVFRKLDVHNRTQLARSVSARPVALEPAEPQTRSATTRPHGRSRPHQARP